jgi:hypothetical protein
VEASYKAKQFRLQKWLPTMVRASLLNANQTAYFFKTVTNCHPLFWRQHLFQTSPNFKSVRFGRGKPPPTQPQLADAMREHNDSLQYWLYLVVQKSFCK